MKSKLRIKGIILVIIAAMLWGVSGTVAQYLFQKKEFSAEWLVVIRLLLSGIILLFYSSIKGKQDIFEIWKSKDDRLKLILFSIIGMLGVQYTYFAAIKYGNAATATILQYLSPVIITCYLAIRTKKMPELQETIAIILAMLGTFLIITKGNIHSISISKLSLFWGISSAFGAAFYTVQPRSLLTKWGSLLIVGWAMLIGGITFSFIHQPWNCVGQWSITSVLAVVFVVLFGTLIAFTCFLESLKYIKPTESSILSAAEPLSAALLAVVWLHEQLGIGQWLGTGLIIITIIILSYAKRGESSKKVEEIVTNMDS
ncbi:putative inner membrane transporter YicL [Clostridium puniceum]|uniref:Putative inner membrane transporter YicL n=1 Tax=Clostridium puniceum TaxID=29367 RepID=A0A1S8TAZ7_9CLOT|nr:EamA family transporter [Clostridium puniceum]OOM74781.1 putative inner membrane transporter YicL [Clostridium puniceum]